MSKTILPSNYAIQLQAGVEYETVTKDGVLHIMVPLVQTDAITGASSASSKTAPSEETTQSGEGGRRGRRPATEQKPAPAEEPAQKMGRGRRPAASGNADAKDKIQDIFSKADDGKITEPDARKALSALSSDKKVKANLELVFDEFMANGDLKLEEIVSLASEALAGKDMSHLAGQGGTEEGSPEGDVVAPEELQEGDLVSVEFKNSEDYEAGWFEGEVIKVGKGRGGKLKITILFEPAEGQTEGDEMDYDANIMGQIVLLPAAE